MKKVKGVLALLIALSMLLPSGIIAMADTDGATTAAVSVSSSGEFNNAVANASTDPNSPTVISVSKNFNVSGGLTIAGTADAKKYIKIVGNGYKVFRSGGTTAWPENTVATGKGLLIVRNAEVELENIELDTYEKGSYPATCLYVGEGAKVTLGEGAKLDSKGGFNTTNGMAVGVDGGTFIMAEGSKVKSAAPNAESPMSPMYGSVIYVYNGGKFIMNGGEISESTAGSGGIIYAKADANTEITLNGGSIVNNKFLHGASTSSNYAVCNDATNYADATMTIGENMEIEGMAVTVHQVTATTNTELTNAINNAVTGLDHQTIITAQASGNINFASNIQIKGTEEAKKNIKIISAKPELRRTGGQASYPDNSNASLKGFITVENAQLELQNVTIDANYNSSKPSATCVYVGTGGKVILSKGANLKKGKGNSNYNGTAVGVDGGSFEMISDSKITGAVCASETSESSTVYVTGTNSSFIMNGGEISGNTAGLNGLIYVNAAEGTSNSVILNSGEIKSNTYNGGAFDADSEEYVTYKGNQNKAVKTAGTGAVDLEISGTMNIDEAICLAEGHKIGITEPMTKNIKINECAVPTAIAVGDGYNITAKDATKFVFANATVKAYVDPTDDTVKTVAVDAEIPDGGLAPDSTTAEDYFIAKNAVEDGVATFTIRSYMQETLEGVGVVALFDGDSLVAVGVQNDAIALGTNDSVDVKVDLPANTETVTGLKMRLFVWGDLAGIIPQIGCLEEQY